MAIYPFRGVWPTIDPSAFIAPGARIIGDVHLGPEVSVWYNAVIRGDTAAIRIGARSNIQDNAVIHTDQGAACLLGEDVTVGHNAIVHGATVGDRVLIAMGATVLSHSQIGDEVIIGASAVIPEHQMIAGGVLVLGVPGKTIRPLTPEERARILRNASGYLQLGREHRAALHAAGIRDGGVRAMKATEEA